MNKTYKYIFSFVLSALAAVPSFAQTGEEIEYDSDLDKIIMRKSVSEDPANSGKYLLTLESFVSGTEEIRPAMPVDFVLVLDVSGSMSDKISDPELSEHIIDFSYYAKNDDGYYYTGSGQHYYYGGDTSNPIYYRYNGKYYILTRPSSLRVKIDNVSRTCYPIQFTDDNGTTHYIIDDGETTDLVRYINEHSDALAKLQDRNCAQYHGPLYYKLRYPKMDYLRSAANSFIDIVKADDDQFSAGTGHRISIVKFANGTTDKKGIDYFESTGYNCSQIVADLTYMSGDGVSVLKDWISQLSPAGGTMSNNGLAKAKEALGLLNSEEPGEGPVRQKIVVMFTDGEPGTNGFATSYANSAIDEAKNIKDAKVIVYSVGIFDESAYSKNKENIDKYMNYVSSNYPVATNMDYTGTAASDAYYKRARTGKDLEEIFKSIATTSIAKHVGYRLESTAVAKDVISDDFKMPEGAGADDIKVYTAPLTGYVDGEYQFGERTSFAGTKELSSDKKTIKVSNFDFSSPDNFCRVIKQYDDKNVLISETYGGKELVVVIPIVVDPEKNDGGAALNTNGPGSGIYLPGQTEPLKEFVSPVLPMPNLVIKKTGMKPGESEVFYVYEGTDTSVKPLYTVIVKEGADGIGHAVLVRLKPGTYTVKESSWNWAYDDDVTSITETVDLSTESETEFVLPGGNKKVKGTHFYFEGLENESSPLHGEDSQNNVFDLSK